MENICFNCQLDTKTYMMNDKFYCYPCSNRFRLDLSHNNENVICLKDTVCEHCKHEGDVYSYREFLFCERCKSDFNDYLEALLGYDLYYNETIQDLNNGELTNEMAAHIIDTMVVPDFKLFLN